MELRLIFSYSAKCDLDEILHYIAKDKPGAATRFIAKLRSSCEQLVKHPLLGEDCSDVQPNTRRLVVQKYLIFYRVTEDTVQITRVIHGARDWFNLLRDE